MREFLIIWNLILLLAVTTVYAGDGTISNPDLADNASVALSKLELIQNNSVVGNASGGVTNPQQLNSAQLTSILDAFTGDSGAGGVKGAVPAPSAGDTGLGKVLHADGTWSVPSTGMNQLTGDVAAGPGSGSQAATIQAGVVSNSKLANMANSTIKCRISSGSGAPEDCTVGQTTAILNVFTGDSGSGGVKGIVPAPSAGDQASGKFLAAGGSWEIPTVSSSGRGDSVWFIGGNATSNGTTNTRIRNFAKVASSGTSLTPSISSTALGSYIQVNETGGYYITYTDNRVGGAFEFGLSRNSTELTTNIRSIHEEARLISASGTTDRPANLSYLGVLNAGDSVRAHGDSNNTATANGDVMLKMIRLW